MGALELAGWTLFAFWAALFLQTCANLATLPRLPRAGRNGTELPFASIVIPARNEERSIGPVLDAALAQDYPRHEVIVVDDGSTDGTAAAIRAREGDPKLVPLRARPLPPGWLGKTNALATGTARARGGFLLLMDADTRLAPSALADGVDYAQRLRLDHLSLIPHFERRGFWEELLMPLLATAFLVFTPTYLARRRRSRLAFGGGAFTLVRRSAYDAIGGHGALKNSVVDDIRLAVELKKAGFESRFVSGTDVARIRMYHGRDEIVRGFEKNAHTLYGGRAWLAALHLPASLALNLGPFAWLLAPALGTPWALALALLLACRSLVSLRFRYPLWPVLLDPLATLAGTTILARSVLVAHGKGVVRWRGREYPRETTRF